MSLPEPRMKHLDGNTSQLLEREKRHETSLKEIACVIKMDKESVESIERGGNDDAHMAVITRKNRKRVESACTHWGDNFIVLIFSGFFFFPLRKLSVGRIALFDMFACFVSEPPRSFFSPLRTRHSLIPDSSSEFKTPRTETFLSRSWTRPVASVESSTHSSIQLLK